MEFEEDGTGRRKRNRGGRRNGGRRGGDEKKEQSGQESETTKNGVPIKTSPVAECRRIQERTETNIQTIERELMPSLTLNSQPELTVSDIYPIKDPKMVGYFLIFNMTHERDGTELDVERLQSCWSHFGFSVQTFNDFNEKKILNTIDEYSKKNMNQSIFAVCILTHGDENSIKDGEKYSFDIKSVKRQMAINKELHDMPKMLIIESCRGPIYPDTFISPVYQKDGSNHISIEADFLLFWATVKGYPAFRLPSEGTNFIQTICDCVEEFGDSLGLMEIFTKVNDRVSRKQVAQIPQLEYNWRRLMFLKKVLK
ncbi:caspase-7-like [Arctopsyche grandis]|uniref:caspase-7-like n=1 Tax=Arctopsyche grandis TaxID=121162 RepID=UPI00406D6E7A